MMCRKSLPSEVFIADIDGYNFIRAKDHFVVFRTYIWSESLKNKFFSNEI